MTPLNRLAAEILAAHDDARLMERPSALHAGLTLAYAYAVADQVRSLRIARGERPRGYKIGFTNRGIWQRYGVHAPVWGPVWDRTLQLLDGPRFKAPLADLVQPRVEPEIVFGFARTPRAGMDEAALQGCLDWVAHGFEIVHTHLEGWRFEAAADAVADAALHGRLYVGPRVPVADWLRLGPDLAALEMVLSCDGAEVDRGRGAIVLDGPLSALSTWVDAMAATTPNWTIEPGDVVTTGTITDAWPLVPGQRWSSAPGDGRLTGLQMDTVA